MWATWSAKWRNLWPSANTRMRLRCRTLDSKAWNCERKALRTGDAIATSLVGSLLSAWRRQLPRRAPGNNVRILLVGVITVLYWQHLLPLGVLLAAVVVGLYPLVKTGLLDLSLTMSH